MSSPPGAYGAAEPLFLLLLALAIEAYVGDRALRFRWVPNLRLMVARLVAGLERCLNRPTRGVRDRTVRGLIVALGLGLLALASGWAAMLLTRNYPFAWGLEVFVLALLVAQRAAWQRAAEVRAALEVGSLAHAREALRPLALGHMRPPEIDALDGPAIVDAALRGLGRRFADGLVAPVFWYALLGLAGLFVQQTTSVTATTLGVRAGAFGQTAARFDRLLVWLPGYLAGLALTAARAFVPGTRPVAGLRRALAPRNDPGAALTAGLGPGRDAAQLGRALAAFAIACVINAGLVALLALVRLAP